MEATTRWHGPRRLFAVAATAVVLAASTSPIVHSVAAFLVLDQALAPASAIVVLAGDTPVREREAAAIYQQGWAPRVVIVGAEPGWVLADVRLKTLLGLGIPADAVVRVEVHAKNTTEELTVAAQAIQAGDEPVILVSSKYHARRLLMTWDRVTAGHRRGIVRVADLDPFDPEHWLETPAMRTKVLHEYLGLLELMAP